MRVYENRRAGRLGFLVWLFVAALAVFAGMAVHGLATGNRDGLLVGAILAGFFLVSLAGLEIYAQRYVRAIVEEEDGTLSVWTRGLFANYRTNPLLEVGREQAWSNTPRGQRAGPGTRHCMLTAGARRQRFILDTTSDTEVAPALRRRLARSRRAR